MVPRDVENFWIEILTRVLNQTSAKDLAAVHQILETLTVSQRPMNFREIDENLHCDSRDFFKEDTVWREIPALYELAGEDLGSRHLRLCHDSVRELLQSSRFKATALKSLAVDAHQAQRNITRRCVSYLLQWGKPTSYTSMYGWTAYAGTYWHKHAKEMAPGGRYSHEAAIWTDCTRLLRSETASFAHWISQTRLDGEHDPDEQGDFGKIKVYPSPLYYAALLGLLPCAEELIYQGADVNVGGGKHGNPLLAAVVSGDTALVSLLLNSGADVESRDPGGYSALTRAVMCSHEEILDVLLSSGVAINAHAPNGATPLYLAAGGTNPSIVRKLLQHGADVNGLTASGETPLQAAVAPLGDWVKAESKTEVEKREAKHIIVELLFAYGVDLGHSENRLALGRTEDGYIKTMIEYLM
ncbi:MAG: hypothetical protein LQ345_003794 [Seirophora villosa]|nr:MAG: hypothetical protein LQ345_003794 [Seirophora villosa]